VWWQYIIIVAVIMLGIYGFLAFTRFETRFLSRRTDRTAADLYPHYADSLRKQRRQVRQHEAEWAGGGQSQEPEDTQLQKHGKTGGDWPVSGSD
jgi:hypothetical protein